jgi:hypothetical protein
MKRIISGLDARRLPRRVVLIAAAVVAGACFAAVPAIPAAVAAPTASAAGVVAPSTTGGQFGANVFVFNPSMTQDSIQSTLDSIASQQVSNQFGSQRYAVFFAPGTYGSSALQASGAAREMSPLTARSTSTTSALAPTASRSTTSGARYRTSRST